MARPAGGAVAEELYEATLPLAYADEAAHDWALLRFYIAIGLMFEPISELVRDSDEGPGWSAALDVDRTPAAWLPWLAMFAGAQLTAGAPEAQHRTEIRKSEGLHRGKPSAIRAKAKAHLTGTKTVTLKERDGSAYRYSVISYEAETPDAAATAADVLAAKPGGLVANHLVFPGWVIDEMEVAYAGQTIDDLEGDFDSIDDLERRLPI